MAKSITKISIAARFAAVVCCTTLRADWAPNFQPGSYPYNFGPSSLVPRWSEVNAGEWTFNYEGAIERAKSEGSYTLLLFAGMWWCPHCQALEKNVLTTDAFAEYVKEQGYYLAALDFPYRDGHSMWTWLWDPGYREANGIGGWTPQQIADEYIRRFEFQAQMHSPTGATTTNNNVLVEISPDGSTTNLAVYADAPTTVYRRVGYPTIIVIDPNGNEAGRFSYNMNIDPSEALEYVINNIESIKVAEYSELFANPGAGGIEGASAQVYDAVLTDASGVPVGIATFKTAKKSATRGTIAVSGSIQIGGGRKILVKGVATGAEGEQILLTKSTAAAAARVVIGTEGVAGFFTDGTANYLVQGARNPFTARDAAAKARASGLQKGFWTFALSNADSGELLGRGYSSFSAAYGTRGKFKVAGTLGDGSAVQLTAQALVGEGGKILVPVIGKKGSYALMIELKGGALSAVKGVDGWKGTKTSAKWSPDAVMAPGPGAGTVPEVMYLQIGGLDSGETVAGLPLAVSPVDDTILSNGRTWTGTKGITDLKVTFKRTDGTFKGTFNVYVQDGGRTKKLRATVSGVVVDGVPYGAAVIKNKISWPVKFAGSCGGGC